MELFKKRYGERFDKEEKTRKREARSVKKIAKDSQQLHGIKGKRHA